jgi:hypothetical protein
LRFFLPRILLCIAAICFFGMNNRAGAQNKIIVRGTVYNQNHTRPLQYASVMSTSGRGTATDSSGNYFIAVDENDSLSFSYLGRETLKYPVNQINTLNNFDIALHVEATELRAIHVAPRDYHRDSVQNREDYAKYFNFKKPGLKISEPSGTEAGVGLDLDELINVFRFNRNRRLAAFQRRLIQEEQDKSVDHRFTHVLVRKITHLNGPELDTFILRYRPSYAFTQTSTDYEFAEYIKLAYQQYKSGKGRPGELKKEKHHP